MKDWVGNGNSIYKTLGASNHTDKAREANDFYATDPAAIDGLLKMHGLTRTIWEPACGDGQLAKRLEQKGYKVIATDLVDRGYGVAGIDFLQASQVPDRDVHCILTNPPYKYALQFVNHALDILPEGDLCCMFLKTTFLEGQQRYDKLFSTRPPRYVFQFAKRVLCAKNADFAGAIAGGGSAVSYAWFVWEKGFTGDTIIRWIDNE